MKEHIIDFLAITAFYLTFGIMAYNGLVLLSVDEGYNAQQTCEDYQMKTQDQQILCDKLTYILGE